MFNLFTIAVDAEAIRSGKVFKKIEGKSFHGYLVISLYRENLADSPGPVLRDILFNGGVDLF
jgi:hypothetical protein